MTHSKPAARDIAGGFCVCHHAALGLVKLDAGLAPRTDWEMAMVAAQPERTGMLEGHPADRPASDADNPDPHVPPTSGADTPPTSNTAVKSWDEKPVSPWRRYSARILDTVTSGTAAFIIIALAWYQLAPLSADAFFSVLDTRAGRFLDLFVTLIAAGIVNAIVLASTGSTFGKLIFGIKVARLDGSPLNLVESFQREIKVCMVGLGFGIPLVSLITMLMSYRTLTKDGHASWDAGKHQVLYRQSGGQAALNVLGIVLIVAARLATSALAKLQ